MAGIREIGSPAIPDRAVALDMISGAVHAQEDTR
jgi:multisubunit Na+/H+ antiporter MnhF subunit